jgi:hypothetical protein
MAIWSRGRGSFPNARRHACQSASKIDPLSASNFDPRSEQAASERAVHSAVASERLAAGLHRVFGFAPKKRARRMAAGAFFERGRHLVPPFVWKIRPDF